MAAATAMAAGKWSRPEARVGDAWPQPCLTASRIEQAGGAARSALMAVRANQLGQGGGNRPGSAYGQVMVAIYHLELHRRAALSCLLDQRTGVLDRCGAVGVALDQPRRHAGGQ